MTKTKINTTGEGKTASSAPLVEERTTEAIEERFWSGVRPNEDQKYINEKGNKLLESTKSPLGRLDLSVPAGGDSEGSGSPEEK